MKEARKQINLALKDCDNGRVHVLMDSRTNRARYQKQQEEAAAREAGQEAK